MYRLYRQVDWGGQPRRFRDGRLAGWHARCAHQRQCQSGPDRAANRSSLDPCGLCVVRANRSSIASPGGDGHNPRSSAAWPLIVPWFAAEPPATKVTGGRCRLIHDGEAGRPAIVSNAGAPGRKAWEENDWRPCPARPIVSTNCDQRALIKTGPVKASGRCARRRQVRA